MKKRSSPAFAAALFATLFAAVATPLPLAAQAGDSSSIFEREEAGDVYDNDGFAYALPGAADELPGLAEQLNAERERARSEFEEMAEETRAAMPGSPAVDHLARQSYWVETGRAGRLLSLAETVYMYSGGAHGITGYDARLWDREEDHAIPFDRLFTDRYAAYSIIDRGFCERLQAMQRERGLEPDDSFWGGCPLLHEQTIAPGGPQGGPLDTIHVVVGPYVAGPYAAGSFEIAVPVTEALLDLIKLDYRNAFAAAR